MNPYENIDWMLNDSQHDGLFDKVSNELKQDSVFKAKMSLAVSNVVEECLNNGVPSNGI